MVVSLEQRVALLERRLAQIALTQTVLYKAAAFMAAEQISGDYLEFGVFEGASFITAHHALREVFEPETPPGIWCSEEEQSGRHSLWEKMRLFAFDSFQGLPKPAGIDTQSDDFCEGQFACSQAQFEQNLWTNGVARDKVIVVPGWYQDTANAAMFARHHITHAAIIHIDCDLYESAKLVLEAITPLVVDGTVLIFDDWFTFKGHPELGEQRACQEWLAAHREFRLVPYQKEGPWKNSFIVHRI